MCDFWRLSFVYMCQRERVMCGSLLHVNTRRVRCYLFRSVFVFAFTVMRIILVPVVSHLVIRFWVDFIHRHRLFDVAKFFRKAVASLVDDAFSFRPFAY